MSASSNEFCFLEDWAHAAGVSVRSPPSIENDGWFLGSALKIYELDYLDAPQGMGGFVDTIWTRHLRIPPPNLYWEIHNEIFHLIWTGDVFVVEQVSSLIAELCVKLEFSPSDLVIFTESDALSAAVGNIRTLRGSLPFTIATQKVGKYSKLFVSNERGVFPAADIVEFEWNGRVVTEVHLNLAHLSVASKRIPTIYSMPSKRNALTVLEVSDSPTSLMSSWRTLRTIALVDAIRIASRSGVTVSTTKAGHTFKMLAKFLAYDLIVTRCTERITDLDLAPDVLRTVDLEISRTQDMDVARMEAADLDFRRGTLGVSDDQLQVANGSASDAPVALPEAGARYFTDLPLLGPISDSKLATEFVRITRGKSVRKSNI